MSASWAYFSLNASNASWALNSLRSLDRAAIHPGAAGRIPYLKGVIGLHDVGIALGCISWQLSFCCHLALKGDAQTRSTLDALLALNTIRTNRTLDASFSLWSLDALGAISASKALHPLGALNALLTLRTFKRAACYPSHGHAGQQPGVSTAAIAVLHR